MRKSYVVFMLLVLWLIVGYGLAGVSALLIGGAAALCGLGAVGLGVFALLRSSSGIKVIGSAGALWFAYLAIVLAKVLPAIAPSPLAIVLTSVVVLWVFIPAATFLVGLLSVVGGVSKAFIRR